jgi:hypothetical protein
MVLWYGGSHYHQCVAFIKERERYQLYLVIKMDRNAFRLKLIGKVGRRFVITGHILAYELKIAGQGTHPDASYPYEIDVMYLVYIHSFKVA